VFFSGLCVKVTHTSLFQVRDTYVGLCRILRLSAFKVHLKKHGLDPETCVDILKRDHSSTRVRRSMGPVRTKEGRVTTLEASFRNQEISLPSLPGSWGQFFPPSGDPCKSVILFTFTESLPPVMTCGVAPYVMQPRQFSGSGLSCSSPLPLTPSPRMVPDYNEGYFLSPPQTTSGSSSPYPSSSVLTPEMGIGFTSDVNFQLKGYLPSEDWITNAWQGCGIQFGIVKD
jgi:hypothetical protein